MQPRIETLKEKKLVGKSIRMSLANNKTFELWGGFMPIRKEIKNNIGSALYSVEVYDSEHFNNFNPQREFEKWASLEVTDHNSIPQGLEALTLPTGLYAVFIHRGPASEGPKTYTYIFQTWLPGSEYVLDDRPHFALMGEKYKNEDPSSEEELWIPIKLKN
jgi:AraC family transcriptional regulator